jgi:riboflavin kinase/FMN adenylyltransferase
MEIYTTLPQTRVLSACALTVGTFDGVHRGHQFLIEHLKRVAKQHSLPTAILTFQDMPFCYFRPQECPRLLTLLDEKIAAFEQLDIDYLFIPPFSADIAEQGYDTFAQKVLCDKLGMKLLMSGPDFALGKGRAGTVEALRELGNATGFQVEVLDSKLSETGAPISSTRVRGAVEAGEIESATHMLGRSFSFEGEVVSGKQLGRTIGVPTINLKTHPRKVLPPHGVYAARAIFPDGATHKAALSIGTNPTTDSDNALKIEFHVINDNIPAPPATARLEVVAKLRDEEKYESLDDLIIQMSRDIEDARQLL